MVVWWIWILTALLCGLCVDFALDFVCLRCCLELNWFYVGVMFADFGLGVWLFSVVSCVVYFGFLIAFVFVWLILACFVCLLDLWWVGLLGFGCLFDLFGFLLVL